MDAKGLIVTHTDPKRGNSPGDREETRCVFPVANKPILCHTLESMAAAGIAEVGIVATAETEATLEAAVGSGKSWGLHVSFLRLDRSDSLAAVLLGGEAFLDAHPFVLQHGDGILRHDLGALVRAVTGQDGPDALLLVHRAHGLRDGRFGRRTQASKLALAGDFTPTRGLVVADAQVFGERFMHQAGDVLRRHREDVSVTALADVLARSGTRVETQRVGAWHRFDGDPYQLLDMNRLLLDELDPGPSDLELRDTQIEGRVAIHPSAHIESSVIRGPAVIGANATIVDAFIGPYTAIGDRTRIEGAEIENSIVCSGAEVLRVGARLESSVVGRDARVARDFSIPEGIRLHIGESAAVVLP